jgi:hypothetical protein
VFRAKNKKPRPFIIEGTRLIDKLVVPPNFSSAAKNAKDDFIENE